MNKKTFSASTYASKGGYTSNQDTSKYEQHSLELKVCDDCEMRHSHKLTDEYYDAKKEAHQHGSNPPSYRDEDRYFTLLAERRTNTPALIANDDSRKPTNESFIGDKPDIRYYSEKPNPGSEKEGSAEKRKWHGSNLSKGEGTFGYNSHRNKSFLDESPIKRNETNNSYSGIWEREITDPKKHRLDTEKERLIKYSKDFESNLQRISDNTDSNLKKDFDKVAHSILHKHVGSSSSMSRNKENDYLYRNVYLNESGDYEERRQPSYDRASRAERSYISDGNTREDSRFTYSTKAKTPSIVTHDRQASAETYQQPEEDDRELTYTGSVADSTERRRIKAFRDIKRHLDQDDPLSSKDSSKLKSSERVRQQFQEEADEFMGVNKGVSIQKLNDRLRKNVKNVEKKERFLLSPPKDQKLVSQAEMNVYGRESVTHKEYEEEPQKDYENVYEDQREYYEHTHQHQPRIVEERPEREDGRVTDRYLEDLPVDKKIKELEERAILSIRHGELDEALERLVLSERIIKSELPTDDPQQIYIHYLLGECYLKMEEYDKAQKVLERAVNLYESNQL